MKTTNENKVMNEILDKWVGKKIRKEILNNIKLYMIKNKTYKIFIEVRKKGDKK